MIDILFDPTDGYWFVAGNQSRVYASARVSYVSVSDATYVDWSANRATPRIVSEQELLDVLINRWVPTYFATGLQIVSTGTPALNDTYPMDADSQAQINGIATSLAAGRGLPGGGSTFVYQGHTFNQTNFLNFASACLNWAYAVYQALGQIVLTGSGSLPTQPVTIS